MPNINYTAVAFWRDFWVLAVVTANTIYTWWSNREKVNSKRFLNLENEVKNRTTNAALAMIEKNRNEICDRHRNRTGSIEGEIMGLRGEINHLPKQGDINRVHARIDEVLGQGKELGGELKATRRQLDLVLAALLNGDK